MPGNLLNLGTVGDMSNTLALHAHDRQTHLYVCGASGAGKSKFLEHLIRQDIKAWKQSRCGLLVIDPHGSLCENTLAWLADGGSAALKRPVVLIDPSQSKQIVAYNVLRERQSVERSVVIDALVEAVALVWGAPNTQHTPLFARWASNLLTLLYHNKLTLAEVASLLQDLPLRQTLAANLDEESMARRDWAMAGQLNTWNFETQIGSSVNRLRSFVENDLFRTMFGQTEVSFDFRRAMEEGWIVLVNLSQQGGKLSEDNASLFGRLLLADLWTAAKEKGKPRDARLIKPFYVYMDEFQKFITPTIAENLDQARGFGLHLTMAHQYPSQLIDEGDNGKRLFNSIMGNVPNKIIFRTLIPKDLPDLAQALFMGTMSPDQIKLKLYSTKVMAYREEERQSTTETHSSTRGRGESTGGGRGTTITEPVDLPYELQGKIGNIAESESDSDSINEFETGGESSSTTTQTVLVPIMGQELSQVQFASLDEQLFQAMQTLRSQDPRHCVVCLANMKIPVSLRTPELDFIPHRPKKVEQYLQESQKGWDFVLTAAEAKRRMDERRHHLMNELKHEPAAEEPRTARAPRRAGKKK